MFVYSSGRFLWSLNIAKKGHWSASKRTFNCRSNMLHWLKFLSFYIPSCKLLWLLIISIQNLLEYLYIPIKLSLFLKCFVGVLATIRLHVDQITNLLLLCSAQCLKSHFFSFSSRISLYKCIYWILNRN